VLGFSSGTGTSARIARGAKNEIANEASKSIVDVIWLEAQAGLPVLQRT
jgi:hypothetical protein